MQAALSGNMRALDEAREAWGPVALEYAATKEGHAHFTSVLDSVDRDDHDAMARYTTLLRRGGELHAANSAAAEEIARKSAAAAAPDVSPVLYAAIDRYSMPRGAADAYLADLVALEHNGRAWAQQPESRTYTGAIRGFDTFERSRLEEFEQTIDPDQWQRVINDSGDTVTITDDRYATLLREHWAQSKSAWVESFDGYHEIVQRVSINQIGRALHHRVAGEQTFTTVIDTDVPELADAATAHPACPASVLTRQVGQWYWREHALAHPHLVHDVEGGPSEVARGRERMSEAAWENARIKRHRDLDLAATLARYDPNPAERLAATLEVTAQPPETLAPSTALALARDLSDLPATVSFDGPATMAAHLGTFLTLRPDLPTRDRAEIASAIAASPAGRQHLLDTGMLQQTAPVATSGWFAHPVAVADTIVIDDTTYPTDTETGYLISDSSYW